MAGVEITLGEAPPRARVAALAEAARACAEAADEDDAAVDDLRQIGLEPSVSAAGVLWRRLPGGEGELLAIRRERVREDSWAGDPEKRVTAGEGVARLHPRRSFELWRAETRGRSLPWSSTDQRAGEILCTRLFALRWVFQRAEREELIARLRRSDEESHRLALVAERANDCVIVTGPEGRIRWVNAAFTQMTGYSFNEALGKTPGALLQGPDTDREEVARIGRALKAHEAVRATLLNYAKDGRPYWIDLDVAPVFDVEGRVEQFVAIERDVTAAREHEAALAEALEAAQTADSLKAEFLRAISHEVRTPLNGVLGVAAVLRHKLDGAHGALIGQIEKNGRSLLEMFSAMLDMAMAESGDLRVDKVAGPVGPALEAAAEAVAPEAREKGISLAVDAAAGACRVMADPERLAQVFIMLLRNAVQFTPPGGRISATVTCESLAAPPRVTIVDQGPGVPEDQREAIFARFRQADGDETRVHGGVGAGLSLARDLVELMGGRIGVEDAPGGAAAFWVELARDPEEARALARAASVEPVEA